MKVFVCYEGKPGTSDNSLLLIIGEFCTFISFVYKMRLINLFQT